MPKQQEKYNPGNEKANFYSRNIMFCLLGRVLLLIFAKFDWKYQFETDMTFPSNEFVLSDTNKRAKNSCTKNKKCILLATHVKRGYYQNNWASVRWTIFNCLGMTHRGRCLLPFSVKRCPFRHIRIFKFLPHK